MLKGSLRTDPPVADPGLEGYATKEGAEQILRLPLLISHANGIHGGHGCKYFDNLQRVVIVLDEISDDHVHSDSAPDMAALQNQARRCPPNENHRQGPPDCPTNKDGIEHTPRNGPHR